MTHRHRWGPPREVRTTATWPHPTLFAVVRGVAVHQVRTCPCGEHRVRLVERRPLAGPLGTATSPWDTQTIGPGDTP